MKHYQAMKTKKAGFFLVRNVWCELVREYHGPYTPIIWITFKGELIL